MIFAVRQRRYDAGSDHLNDFPAFPQQGADRPPRGDSPPPCSFVSQRVAVTQRRAAAGGAAVHPTAALCPYRGDRTVSRYGTPPPA